MGKFSDHILVSDYDQTMTDRTGKIPPSNLEAIGYFMENGGIFTLASGRSLPTARHRFSSVPVNAPWILYNGGACYDPVTAQFLFCHPLPEDCMPLLRSLMDRYPHLRQEFHTLEAHYIFGADSERTDYLKSQHAKYLYAPWEDVPDSKITYCLYSTAPGAWTLPADSEESRFFAQLEAEINQLGQGRILALNSLPAMVEIQAAGVSKGKAARDLAKQYGRKILVCAGDAVNDLSMLEEADLSFVPADCDSRVKARGFREAAPCGEGTIAHIIRQL